MHLENIPRSITLVVKMPVEAEDWTFLYGAKKPPSFDDLMAGLSRPQACNLNSGSNPETAMDYPTYPSFNEIKLKSHLWIALEREKLIREFGERRCQNLKEDLASLREQYDFLLYVSHISAT